MNTMKILGNGRNLPGDILNFLLQKIRKRMEKMNMIKILGSGSDLPEAIIEEICLRLPVKSLLRFRCVSKSWRSFISSKQFAQAHLQLQKQNHVADRSVVFVSAAKGGIYTLNHCPVGSLFCKKSISHSTVHDQFEFHRFKNYSRNKPVVVGCCNGLCCLFIPVPYGSFILWNPCTGTSRRLPDTVQIPVLYGFGFDESDDDYKVYAMCLRVGECLYSLKTNSWKVTQSQRIKWQSVHGRRQGAFVNGKLHWVESSQIISLDLGNACPGVVEQPISATVAEVDVLQGCLCAMYDNYLLAARDFWIMKEYGAKDSWCKQFTVTDFTGLCEMYWNPLCVSDDGEVLYALNGYTGIYSVKTGSWRLILISNIMVNGLSAGVYRPSLVSPFLDGEPEEQS